MGVRLAIILLLNGVQIWLPAPAFFEGGHTYVPLREVFQRLGWTVRWDNAAGVAEISAQGQESITLRLGDATARVGGRVEALPVAPRRVSGSVYIPARALTYAPGLRVAWEGRTRTLRVDGPSAAPVTRVTPGMVAAAGPSWNGRVVTIAGAYMGGHADPLDPLTANGPPRTRSDWVLHGADGSIYCAAGSGAVPSVSGGLGRRVLVTGVIGIARAGFPYLQPQAIEALSGLEGLTRYVKLTRRRVSPGETTTFTLRVANPTSEPIEVLFPTGQRFDFTVTTVDGREVWRWSEGRVFTMALGSRTLAPGEQYDESVQWTVQTADGKPLGPGRYLVRGELTPTLGAYPASIEVR